MTRQRIKRDGMLKVERTKSVTQITNFSEIAAIAIGHDMTDHLSIATDLQSQPLTWVGRIKYPTSYTYSIAALNVTA